MTCKNCDKYQVCKRIDYEIEYHNKSIEEAEEELVKSCRLFRPAQGTWTLNTDGTGTCSECNMTQYAVYDQDNWQRYCGCCGARMTDIKSKHN